MTRREMLQKSSAGFGSLALAGLLGEEAKAAAPENPLSTRPPHFPPKAKRIIFLFMHGGPSHMDLTDPKPELTRMDGKEYSGNVQYSFANEANSKLLGSPWKFKKHGQCGMELSDLLPYTGTIADDICLIRSMHTEAFNHHPGQLMMNTGVPRFGLPSVGSWLNYGLGSQSENLPGYVVLNGGQIPAGGLDNFSNGFLPATYRGNLLNVIGTPLANVKPNEKFGRAQEIKRRLAQKLNRGTAGGIDALESAIANHELAARMQLAIPEVVSLDGETEATKKLYGFDSKDKHTQTYARECLLARRLIERGVRFVELTIAVARPERWDAHSNLVTNHSTNARAVDQPIAGLIRDLKSRGLLDETLVVWSGEFGRTPFAQGGKGRDHNEYGFSLWMAGGGIKPGVAYGATDDWGYKAVDKPLQIHDLHATMLHQLGIDHEELTYRFSGRDIRLTDVHGKIIDDILL